MYTTIQTIHSYWAYLALLLLVIAIVNGFIGISRDKEFTEKDRKISLFAMLATHIQFLIGIILLFTSPYWASLMESGMGEAMGNSLVRLYTVEHPLTNVIAIIFITIGWSKHKKNENATGKFKNISYLYLIGLVLLISRIPFNAWFS
jgi:heme A synthase